MDATEPQSPSSVPLLTALAFVIAGLASLVFMLDLAEAMFLAIPTAAVAGVAAAAVGITRIVRDGAGARRSAWVLAAAGGAVFIAAVVFGVWMVEALSHME